MNEEDQLSEEYNRISQDAAFWIVQHDRGLTAVQQDEFFEWLAEDPRHGERFAESRQSWGDFNLLAQWRPEHSEEPNPDLLANVMPPRSWKSWAMFGGIAATIALFVSVFWMTNRETPIEPTGAYVLNYSALDYGYHRLEDGSEIDLNQGTELRVSYSATERLVELISGEAHFMVAKDSSRPFVVKALGASVKAVGTAFNVRLGNESVEVLVTQGIVRMEEADVGGLMNPSGRASSYVSEELVSGQRSVMSFKEQKSIVQTSVVQAEEINKLLEWKPDVLDFSSTPLSEAIFEFNKRNETQIVIADSELASQPIVASFRSNNINGFVRLLNLTMAIEADRQYDKEIILYSGN